MFAVQISHDNFIQNPYLNITFETRDYVTLQDGTKDRKIFPTELEPCTVEHWSQLPTHSVNWTESFFRFNFKQFLCPKKDFYFLLGGSYNSEHFYHWKFSIVQCSNDTMPNALWKPVCKSNEDVEKYFNKTQNIRFNIYTSNFVINALESNNYVNNYIEDSIFFQIQNKNSYITSDIYFSENIIQTDQSLLPFPNIKNETIITFQSGNFRPQYKFGQTGNVYADFFIRKDPFVYKTNRAFQKISQIISYIGGFAQIFILVTAILDVNKNIDFVLDLDLNNLFNKQTVNYYNEYIYAISLANKIYDFQFQNSKQNLNRRNQQISIESSKKNRQNKYFMEEGSLKNIQDSKFNNKNQQGVLTDQHDLEKQGKTKGSEEDIEMNLVNVNQKKIMNREDDGLLPLDELKAIILQRKQQIEQQQLNKPPQKKQSSQNQKKQIISTEEQIELEQRQVEEENQQTVANQIQNIDKDSVSIFESNQKVEDNQQR